MIRSGKIRTNSCTKTGRRGITLLEVLISMFVALVGLSGLAALFWLGGVEMSEGAKLDRAMSVARSAQRSLKIYGILRPIQSYTTTTGGIPTTNLMQMWVAPNAGSSKTNAQFIDTLPTNTPAPAMPFSTASNPMPYGYYTQGFAIDPIGILANQGHNDSAGDPVDVAFPGIDGTATLGAITYTATGASASTSGPPNSAYAASTHKLPCLSRVTLMAFPQPLVPLAKTPWIWTPATTHGQTYTTGQADLIFRSGDDLLLNPPNGDFPPTQFFSSLTGPARRQSQGDFSWLATVVPSNFGYDVTTTGTPVYAPVGDTNLVRVSIVVFYKRNPLITLDPTGTVPPSERMVGVNNTGTPTTLSGIAGGDIQLSTNVANAQNYLNLKAGQWIMLSQLSSNGPLALNPTGSTVASTTKQAYTNYWYRWYKVVATGPVQGPTGGAYTRNVTLSGPDWNPTNVTYASIFDGVVAVYEKEIELEPSGAPLAPN